MNSSADFADAFATDPFEGDHPLERDEDQFFAVDRNFVLSGTTREFDLYIRGGERFLLYRSKEFPVTAADATALAKGGTRTLYVLNSERGQYVAHLEKSMLQTVVDDSIPLDARADALYDLSASVISDLAANPMSKRNLSRSRDVVDGIATFIGFSSGALRSLFSCERSEAYAITHGIDTCIYGIGLGVASGIRDRDELRALGVGCLLHDVGKHLIPERIVNKPAHLSSAEWAILRRHPELGVQICRNSQEIDERSLVPIQQHHERLDGSGYPRGLSGDQIHLFSRITAAADVFDALTSDRPYADAEPTFPALKRMKDEMDGKLDTDAFRQLVLMLKEE
jgi:HD-GYP domain-containing protein (c-di-GMP phosphodiesterase class II)